MTKKAESESRRRLLKQLAAGGGVAVGANSLPELWTKPVVNSVLLPTHAQTTPTPAEQCSAPAGCYDGVDLSDRTSFSVRWPGGGGLKLNVPAFPGDGCVDSSGSFNMALVRSATEAKQLLNCPGAGLVVKLVDLGECGIWECCDNCQDAE